MTECSEAARDAFGTLVSLSSQEILLSPQLKYITAHAQVKREREILSCPLTGADGHYQV